MHCASCAGIIEKTLKKAEGVSAVSVNYGTESATIEFDDAKTNLNALSAMIEPLGYSLDSGEGHGERLDVNQSKHEKMMELARMKMGVLSMLPLAFISIGIMSWDALMLAGAAPDMPRVVEVFFHHLLPVMATYALFVAGKPYLLGVYRFFRYGKANMDTLIGLGTSAAFLYSFILTAFEEVLAPYVNVDQTYYDVTIVIIAFIVLGKYLEVRSKQKTGDAIEQLLRLQAKTALVIREGRETEIALSDVVRNDVIVVKPAGRIPVDGEVIEGSSYVDESVVTGEPMPVKKSVGDMVVSGTMNTEGSFRFRATKVGAETMLSRIIAMVEEAQGSRAPIQALADRISAVFVPIVLGIACVALVGWIGIGTQYFGFSQALSYGLVSFVSVLVIACPCALGLATPTAIIVGVGKGARAGILVKDAATLETLHRVDTIAFDKTGTITKGTPELVSIRVLADRDESSVLQIVASLEATSEHPIAKAMLRSASEKNISVLPITDFLAVKGKGVQGILGSETYFVGNGALMDSIGVTYDREMVDCAAAEGKTPVLVASATKILAMLLVADAVKDGAAVMVRSLHRQHLRVVMITGDHAATAAAIAKDVDIDDVIAGVLPDGKRDVIQKLQAEGRRVAMVGDGVNDAPALAQADVGIAMATGTDVAIESAGITLLHGNIANVPKAIVLSRMTMRGIKQNLFWAFFYNVIGIPLAAGIFFPFFGWLLSPVFAGIAMAFSSVSVVANSLRITTKAL